jgi:translation elongation factor EF-1alpha
LVVARAMGVARVVVVVTKMGSCAWDEKVFKGVKVRMQKILEELGIANVEFIAFDSVSN